MGKKRYWKKYKRADPGCDLPEWEEITEEEAEKYLNGYWKDPLDLLAEGTELWTPFADYVLSENKPEE